MKNKLYKIGLYIRLSREDGDNLESYSVSNQRDILLSFIKDKKDFIYVDEYIDDGYSGSNFDRPSWNRLIRDINNKKLNTIITKDLSRMGRDYILMGNYIERVFPENNIRYIAINDDIDTFYESPGLEYLQFKLIFNDFYIKDGSKKVRKVLRNKKEQGKYTGWKGVYGYKRDPNNIHKLIIDEKVKDSVVHMFNFAKLGKSPREIANIMTKKKILTPSAYANLYNKTNNWSDRTIKDILINQTYIGNLRQGIRRKVGYKSKKEVRVPKEEWIIVSNTHEAIIDKETFDIVQSNLKKNKNKIINKYNHLLKGFLYCKECNHKIGINTSFDKKRRYCMCRNYCANSKDKLCTPHSMNYDNLEKEVLENTKRILNENIDKEINIKNFSRDILIYLIDKIIIDENKNIEIYYNFKV